jgi:hypothetical protein
MTRPSIGVASAVYEAAENCLVTRFVLTHAGFNTFATGLSRLERNVGDIGDDPYWRQVFQLLRRLRFDLAATPLDFNHSAFRQEESRQTLSRLLAQCKALFPDRAADLNQLIALADDLVAQSINPIGDTINGLLSRSTPVSTALLLRSTRYATFVRSEIQKDNPDWTVSIISESHLNDNQVFDLMLVVGPARWFPASLLWAPRATRIELIYFSWLRDQMSSAQLFPRSRLGRGFLSRSPETTDQLDGHAIPVEFVESDDVLPRIYWHDLADRVGRDEPTYGEEQVPAYMLLLAGGFATYVEASDDAFVYVVDPIAPPTQRIRKHGTETITEGMHVLVRREGGGDYVSATADKLLGEAAQSLRKKQADWKQRLRTHVESAGIGRTVNELRQLGAARASTSNVRHWMGRHSLRTDDFADFSAVLRLVGLEPVEREYWDAMGRLDSAHRSAGFFIRQLLLRQVIRADLEPLQASGRMDFQLEQGGTMTAFRVEQKSPEAILVPVGRLGKPFAVEPDLWQG